MQQTVSGSHTIGFFYEVRYAPVAQNSVHDYLTGCCGSIIRPSVAQRDDEAIYLSLSSSGRFDYLHQK